MGSYNTQQRQELLQFLEEKPDEHFTVRRIVSELENRNVHIGVTTVYRQLDSLVESGKVRRFDDADGSGCCYQLAGGEDCHNHYHLKCLRCGKLFHVECDFLDTLEEHIYEHHRFRVQGEKTVLYGICEECGK